MGQVYLKTEWHFLPHPPSIHSSALVSPTVCWLGEVTCVGGKASGTVYGPKTPMLLNRDPGSERWHAPPSVVGALRCRMDALSSSARPRRLV